MKSFKQFLKESKNSKEMQRLIAAHQLAANTVASEISIPNRPNLTPDEVMKMSGRKAIEKSIKDRKKRMLKGIKSIMKH
jgi:hypothetical protein